MILLLSPSPVPMSNAISPLVFRNADACFQALSTSDVLNGTVVVIGKTPMRVEVGRFKDKPVALEPMTGGTSGKGQPRNLWQRFVAMLCRLVHRRGARTITPSRRQAAAIVARSEHARRRKMYESLWLREAATSAVSGRGREGAGTAQSDAALKDRVVARFAPDIAQALASIREVYARLPAAQADAVARDIMRPLAREFEHAMAGCRGAGMSAAQCKEMETAVWDPLAKEMSLQMADRHVPATVTDPRERALQRRDIARKAEGRVQRGAGGARQERLDEAVAALDAIDRGSLSAIPARNQFALRCRADDPPEMHDYAAMHILTQLKARVDEPELAELFAMIKDTSPATLGSVTAELAMRWQAACHVPNQHGNAVALAEPITQAMGALLNGDLYYTTETATYLPLPAMAEKIRQAANPVKGAKG